MANRGLFSGQNLPLTSIAEYHHDCERSLRLYFSPKNVDYTSRFSGYTQIEIREELQLRLDELDKLISFSILSALEASLLIDYFKRCQQKKKDPLSKELRKIYKQKESRASLEDDILKLWKETHPQYKNSISEVIAAFKYRHWLAHGRYWEPKLGRNYDYNSLYDLAYSIEQLLISSFT
jgi:hypothetical protein